MIVSNTKLIFVDFGNADEDGAIRLVTFGTLQDLFEEGIELREGIVLKISDGELIADATVAFREGMWVALINNWEADEAPDTQSPRSSKAPDTRV